MLSLILIISSVLSSGLHDYEHPKGLIEMGAQFYSTSRTGTPNNYRTHRVKADILGDLFEFLLNDDPEKKFHETNLETRLPETYLPLIVTIIVLTSLFFLWAIVWCTIQCCKCCLFPTRRFTNPTCCWGKTGPNKCVSCTSRVFFIFVALSMLYPVALSIVGLTVLKNRLGDHYDRIVCATNGTISFIQTVQSFTNVTAPFKTAVATIANGSFPEPIVTAATQIVKSISSADDFITNLVEDPLEDIIKFRNKLIEPEGKRDVTYGRTGFIVVICFVAVAAVIRLIIAFCASCCCGSQAIGCQICWEFCSAITLGSAGLCIAAMSIAANEGGMFLYGGAGLSFLGREKVIERIDADINTYLGDDRENNYSVAHYVSFNQSVFLTTASEILKGNTNSTTTEFLLSLKRSLDSFGGFFDTLAADNDTNPLLHDDPTWQIPTDVLATLQDSATASAAARKSLYNSAARLLNPAALPQQYLEAVNIILVDYGRVSAVFWLVVITALSMRLVYVALLMCGRKYWDRYVFTIDSAGNRVFYPLSSVNGKRIMMLNTNGDPDDEQGGQGQELRMGNTTTPQPVLYYQRGHSLPMTKEDDNSNERWYSAHAPTITPPFSCSYATEAPPASAPSAGFQPYPEVQPLHAAPMKTEKSESALPPPFRFTPDNPPPPPPLPAPFTAI